MFVGHSLGGIVIKQALIIAAAHRNAKRHVTIGALYSHTAGVVLMGTPHRGSSKAVWAQMMQQIAKAALQQPGHSLVQTLGEESDVLEILLGEFTTVSNELPLVSFWEEYPTTYGMVRLTASLALAGN